MTPDQERIFHAAVKIFAASCGANVTVDGVPMNAVVAVKVAAMIDREVRESFPNPIDPARKDATA